MNPTEAQPNSIDPEVMADLEAAARYAVTGQCDPAILRRIEERAERARGELGRKVGVREVGVSLIREMRESR
jgi:hypothetical protein